MDTVRRLLRGVALPALGLAVACQGTSSTSPTPPPSPGGSAIVTITAAGVSPKALVVPRGSQVTFVNEDGRPHQMASDPHPEHVECPEINSVGYLTQGQSRLTGNLNTEAICGFHDHLNGSNAALHGTITVE